MQLPSRLAHLQPIIPRQNRNKPVSELLAGKTEPMAIYVVQCHEFVKIGIAANPHARLAQLQVGCPYKLTLAGFWRSAHAIGEEEMIHSFLDEYRERGEWFKLPQPVIDLFAARFEKHA